MTLLLLIISVVSFQPASAGAGQGCLSYEPSVTTLSGTIKRKTFAGPPNYQSVARGDQPEVMWVLHLTKPICVTANEDWEAEKNVSDVQLVFPEAEKQYARYRSLVSRRGVAVTGTLFHAHTGHHYTKLLLTVSRMRKKM
jgi:hypothetical protein